MPTVLAVVLLIVEPFFASVPRDVKCSKGCEMFQGKWSVPNLLSLAGFT